MELTIKEHEIKKMVKDALAEILVEKRELFYDLIVEAIEDAGLVQAIKKGRKDNFVDEDRIMNILENK
ncbi:MAG TPA: hypothetical protein ENH29_09300 [Bacteroidetes bacterium]|nr:hypothetical protein [Bacteroidota bacterium]